MANTKWFQHGAHQWHVEEGSPAHRNLVKEGAVEIEDPAVAAEEGDAPKEEPKESKPKARGKKAEQEPPAE